MNRVTQIVLLVSGLVGGCAQSGSVNTGATGQSVALKSAIAAECKMLGRAFQMSGRRSVSIVEGCPGYKNVKASSPSISEAGLFVSAASAKLPASVSSDSTAQRLYRRMIARGTPRAVAVRVAKTAEFRRAVAAARKL